MKTYSINEIFAGAYDNAIHNIMMEVREIVGENIPCDLAMAMRIQEFAAKSNIRFDVNGNFANTNEI